MRSNIIAGVILLVGFLLSTLYFVIIGSTLQFDNIIVKFIFYLIPYLLVGVFFYKMRSRGTIRMSLLSFVGFFVVPLFYALLIGAVAEDAGRGYGGWTGPGYKCECTGVFFTTQSSLTDQADKYYCLGNAHSCPAPGEGQCKVNGGECLSSIEECNGAIINLGCTPDQVCCLLGQ